MCALARRTCRRYKPSLEGDGSFSLGLTQKHGFTRAIPVANEREKEREREKELERGMRMKRIF